MQYWPYIIVMPTFFGVITGVVFAVASRKKVKSVAELLIAGVFLAIFFSILAGSVPGPWQAANVYLLESPGSGSASEKIVEDFVVEEIKLMRYQVDFTVVSMVPCLYMVRRFIGSPNEGTNK
ncbi:hypothetical protein [Alcanivorax sp. DP30]|uniref:hypothetical protein n=1 Tax=Alcanivorax sp. DP30 TaxID=2606217 RepID=UPI00136CDBCC|nr:hypothetical protein [Alcanivorax sp. DP30]MZR63526.1 hypothetical protein [Alcanivorax sp. DP30]